LGEKKTPQQKTHIKEKERQDYCWAVCWGGGLGGGLGLWVGFFLGEKKPQARKDPIRRKKPGNAPVTTSTTGTRTREARKKPSPQWNGVYIPYGSEEGGEKGQRYVLGREEQISLRGNEELVGAK